MLRQAAPAAAVLLASALQVQAQERASEPGSCVAAIRAVLTDIAARDLNTSAGPPLNAFLTLNPSAMEQAEALDRKTAAGDPKGALFCVRGELAAIDIARQNELRLRLGEVCFVRSLIGVRDQQRRRKCVTSCMSGPVNAGASTGDDEP